MSGENLTSKEMKTTPGGSFENPQRPKVNINNLLYKIRAEKVREKKENYMFLGLVVGLLTVTGIIVSL